MKRFILILFSFVLLGEIAVGQDQLAREHTREGNKHYQNNDLEKAEIEYLKAIEARSDYYNARYNLGIVNFDNEKYEDANSMFTELTYTTDDKEQKAELYFNIGNGFMKQEKFKEAYDAYKQSLRQNPSDKDAKYNLLYARSKLKEEEQQQQQQQNQDQNQDQKQDQDKEQDEKKDNKDDKEGDKKEQDKQQDEKQDKDKEGDDKQQEQQQGKPKVDKENAKKQMARMAENDKKTKEKVDKKALVGGRNKKEKDW